MTTHDGPEFVIDHTAQRHDPTRSEVYLRTQIAEATSSWFSRFGAPRVLTALREWLDYMDRAQEINERHDGGTGCVCGEINFRHCPVHQNDGLDDTGTLGS